MMSGKPDCSKIAACNFFLSVSWSHTKPHSLPSILRAVIPRNCWRCWDDDTLSSSTLLWASSPDLGSGDGLREPARWSGDRLRDRRLARPDDDAGAGRAMISEPTARKMSENGNEMVGFVVFIHFQTCRKTIMFLVWMHKSELHVW